MLYAAEVRVNGITQRTFSLAYVFLPHKYVRQEATKPQASRGVNCTFSAFPIPRRYKKCPFQNQDESRQNIVRRTFARKFLMEYLHHRAFSLTDLFLLPLVLQLTGTLFRCHLWDKNLSKISCFMTSFEAKQDIFRCLQHGWDFGNPPKVQQIPKRW
jgi:hypothetical protein